MSTKRTTPADTEPAPANGASLAADDDSRLDRDHRRQLLAGGNAKHAPHSQSELERRPIEGASSGTSWDDPDEL